jgi:S1-C subfamily serine protease
MSCRTHIAAKILVAAFIAMSATACAGPSDRGELLATIAMPARAGVELTSTGFFVDRSGHVMTAGHAAANCRDLSVTKDGRSLPAQLIARSVDDDLAVLKVDYDSGTAGVFARKTGSDTPELIFAAGSYALPGILANGGTLFNAVLTSGDERDPRGQIELISNATFGSSGAPVLGANGLVIGVITHRVPSRVLATGAQRAKAFLAASGVTVADDDRPQLRAFDDRASYAASISATVTCRK